MKSLVKFFQGRARAFTVVELLVVTVIIGIIIAIAFAAFSNLRAQARDRQRASDIKAVREALELYFNRYNTYPAALTPGQPLVAADGKTFLKKCLPIRHRLTAVV